MKKSTKNNVILTALLDRYWKVIAKEDIGKTPDLTKEADELELEIRKLTAKTQNQS
jgi:hypothetical protein